ncbi:hypothetical protein B9Z55_004045 [Caenorhabditis nigoni]|uniref:Uncharacterized protein n=1 Tax=Caenorhabditis nigoni TaxID=1611254 RepID=A0A2G5UUL5_9PELO|nr:hypothetical protein B9Z55_004045 [Caenorhabditis nigoni]
MKLLLLVVVLTTIVNCQDSSTAVSSTTSLDCGYLASYKNIHCPDYGQCCNTDAVAYMDREYGSDWRKKLSVAQSRISYLYNEGLCTVSSTSSPTAIISTTKKLKYSTTKLNCNWLKDSYESIIPTYNGECCNAESVDYLNAKYGDEWINSKYRHEYIFALRRSGDFDGSTTSTSITTTSEFESTNLARSTKAEAYSNSGECMFSVTNNVSCGNHRNL